MEPYLTKDSAYKALRYFPNNFVVKQRWTSPPGDGVCNWTCSKFTLLLELTGIFFLQISLSFLGVDSHDWPCSEPLNVRAADAVVF